MRAAARDRGLGSPLSFIPIHKEQDMFGFFKNPHASNDAALVKQALGPHVAVIVSASCCVQGTADTDAKVDAVVQSALKKAGRDWPVLTVTVTQAQSTLGTIARELDEAQSQVAREVSELFATTGLSAFPVLIVDQHIVSYGGVPGEALVTDALNRNRQVSHENAA
ncbi:hypothetical protein [Roseateles sp. LKC17W]|uniref:Thioredoxin-like fold domain-containing protein n=1 Tax=Pelomonas margarita TaxID=3299031 RepID=A0ABW7FFK7_9BURK